MEKRTLFLFVVLVICSQVDLLSGNLESIFEQCCTFGTGWAHSRTTCKGFPVPVPGLASEHQSTCLSALEICCIRTHRTKKCEAGKEAAHSGQDCTVAPPIGGEAQKDCCEGCKLGLIAASKKKSCVFTSFAFGSPWDETFYECCSKQSNEVLPQTAHLPRLPDTAPSRCDTSNPCSQKCIDTGVAVQCDCYPGYVLAPDKHSCEDVNECEKGTHSCNPLTEECRNTVGGFQCFEKGGTVPRTVQHHRPDPCPDGYTMNRETGTCDDVDECMLHTDHCNRQTEVCSNTIGSFSCTIQTPSQCPPGFKYHDATKRCTDVDECAEGRDDCNRDLEFCLNSFGGYQCQERTNKECPAGYKWNKDRSTCEDIDECTEGTHSCNLKTQICINTIGSFKCSTKTPDCPHGYKKNTLTNQCEDINECTYNIHDCDLKTQYCVNTLGSYQCQTKTAQPVLQKCGTGFVTDPSTGICKDINECEELSPCPADQLCDNTLGSYRCLCRRGYHMNPATRLCEDINECQRGMHNCVDSSQRCDNTIGSYTCVRVTSCGTGYTLNAGTGECEDDDECLLHNHNCGPGFICRNTLGSFRCDRVHCPHGQKLLADGSCQVIICNIGTEPDSSGNCIDINECTNRSVCRHNQRCINTVGSYRCQNLLTCSSGYEINEYGTQCVDIDECARRIHECGHNQICQNRPGGYACSCPAGYTLNSRQECEDVDECVQYQKVCPTSSECHNTPGSYICNCKLGFKHAGDGHNCIDIDECVESTKLCQQNCRNSWGSYKCSCAQGYALGPDGRSCHDIDECALAEGRGNLCIGFCVNQPGSYSCSCPEGYKLDSNRRTCQDIDECQLQNVCKGGNEVCLNTRGGYKCNTVICPPNYIRDRDHKNRCKRSSTECRGTSYAECLKEPLSYSYNYITFVSGMKIPPSGQIDLFTMRGPRTQNTNVQFFLTLKDARAPEGITPATQDYFRLRRTAVNEAMISLVKSIPGPQEIELELNLKLYHNGLSGGSAIAKIFIYVTRYEF